MTDRQWHYATDGASIGPRTTPEMQALIAQGAVTGQTLVWTEGMSQWAEAATTELRGFPGARSVPPPPPAAAAAFAAAPPQAGPAPWMGFGEAIRYSFGNYVKFSGRGSRSQYWFFALFQFLLGIAATILDTALGYSWESTGPLNGLVNLALLIPSLAAASRRFHDAGWSFWWFLTIFVPVLGWIFVIYVLVTRDTRPNRFDAP